LKLLFKSSYVQRSRQGSSTFSGTIGPAGKVIGAPVKVVGKVGGGVGGGIMKGASFMRQGFRSKTDKTITQSDVAEPQANGSAAAVDPDKPLPSIERSSPGPEVEAVPAIGASTAMHGRSPSAGARSMTTASKAETGTAEVTVLSATGYPTSTKVQVIIKQMGPKAREVIKTKGIKASGADDTVKFEGESTRIGCSADTQFHLLVKDHHTFGGGDDLGDTTFFLDDSEAGSERSFKAGSGTVVVKTSFASSDTASLKDNRSMRRSLLSKREPSRQLTPSAN
jgi:hypothetical protein